MAEELDVIDIEGDETDGIVGETEQAEIIQAQYLQSGWQDNSGSLPWTLDSSISPENREAIKSMLLEEEYYFAGKQAPRSLFMDEKQKMKKSPIKPAAAPARWAQEEKDLFEKGLTQFGRRWTKVAKLIGSRTVLQVKSYARQYFRNKAKLDEPQIKSAGVSLSTRCPFAPVEDRAALLSTAVRIERLSDDEDVDITDELSGDTPLPEGLAELDGQVGCADAPRGQSPTSPSLPCCVGAEPNTVLDESVQSSVPESLKPPVSPSVNGTEPEDEAGQLEEGVGLEEEFEEEEELKAPEQEVQLDTSIITEEEKQALSEFFEGRPSKTPERYFKIRNYILDQWMKCKPKYLNKTSVRPGLKNCGDVNCIGRIHTYLELIGAINFNCEQAIYNRPRVVDRSRMKEGRDTIEAYQLAQRLQSMRTRKRRVRDMWGNWCDAKELEGQTYEHLSAEELAKKREEDLRQSKPGKMPRLKGSSFDPFQLIPCQTFGKDKKEPFEVMVCVEALVVMDMHAHVSMGEVIGLLGGTYSEDKELLKICAAEPCNSLSTGLQCEMDPVSQTQASELLAGQGYSIVGWYHSHPAFAPNPSLRDIDTQAKFQSYFSRGGAPFIGMIVSPYNPTNTSIYSQITCLVVSEEQDPSGLHRLPFMFETRQSREEPDWTQVLRRAEWIVYKYRNSHSSVPIGRLYRRDSQLTCLEKMLASLRKSLEQLHDSVSSTFLAQIETLFLTGFPEEENCDSGSKVKQNAHSR